tara:strand:+ start:593 stop:1030 length:438 start_codon:yes stop_codon:yes gene_type:complete
MSSKSLYETFGNEVSYEQRRGKLVQFIENNTINFPLPEASIEILVNMIPGDFKGIDPSKVEIIENRLTSIGFTGPTAKTLASALIQVADAQGVHPISYFELNEESIKLAEQTYKAINSIRPKGNQIGLTVDKFNKDSKLAKIIRP